MPSLWPCWKDLPRTYTEILLHVVRDQYLVDISLGRALPMTRGSLLSEQDLPFMDDTNWRKPLGYRAENLLPVISPPAGSWGSSPSFLSLRVWSEGYGSPHLFWPQLSIHSSPLCHPRLLPPSRVACDCSGDGRGSWKSTQRPYLPLFLLYPST